MEKNQKFFSKLKKLLEKTWFLLWKDDSIKGWIFSIVILFLFIKFLFFPALSFVTGTSLPLAIVESCSMYHEGIFPNYNSWWEQHEGKYSSYDLEKNEFEGFVFKNGFNKGDILFIIGANPEKLKVGDVIIFDAGQRNPVIHRIIKIRQDEGKYFFSTIGDNNNGQLSVEENIGEAQLMGKAIFKVTPFLGWGKLVFFEGAREPSQKGFCHQN